MANIFSKKDQYIDRVNRSTFDLSFVNNFTTNFGVITPVCLLPVGFGDSVQIDAKFNLQLMPTVFPIQTQMYARLHFVYVRTRTIWEDWQKFFGGDESVVPPWLDFAGAANPNKISVADDLQTSTLADYLGVPTTITGTYGQTSESNKASYGSLQGISFNNVKVTPADLNYVFGCSFPVGTVYDTLEAWYNTVATNPITQVFAADTIVTGAGSKGGHIVPYFGIPYAFTFPSGMDSIRIMIPTKFFDVVSDAVCLFLYSATGAHTASYPPSAFSVDGNNLVFDLQKTAYGNSASFVLWFNVNCINSGYYEYVNGKVDSGSSTKDCSILSLLGFMPSFTYVSSSVEWTKPEAANCPFYTSDSGVLPPIPLSALPFRVYEAYYNAFARDVRNNPFMIDGKPEYNRYVPSLAGGADGYKYQLHYANWEPDAYTTALQSPQAGVAPLVGITSLGEAQFRDANGTTYTAQLETADDGDTVTGFQMKSSEAPADVVRNLIGMATSGISISDFRNVNSLQRFLEIRIRQSPRYLNLVKGLFNVNLDYDELMMPEFLGGISDNVPVYKVTQTTPTDGSPLGSFAGQGFIQSGMKHVIRKYCPEEGYILGVLSVVPAANYTQLLMPHWTRMSLLDWHFPQFNNVSFQPMIYKNLCPYQAYAVNPKNVNNVFGYQRAWWDLISSFDEVHGQFRSSLRNFVINRVFDSAPELSQDFLLVNPDHVNDVFSTTAENGDKILGSIAFNITKKTTIPRNSIPHIE